MALIIKGIEAAKPKINKTTGISKLVRFSDGNGLFLEVTETSKRWRVRYFSDLDIEHDTVDLLRIFGFYNQHKDNASLSLSLGMKPSRKERIRFKQRLSCLCKSEGPEAGEHFCSLKKSYAGLEQLTSSDIQTHAEELSGLYQSMKRIREQLIGSMKDDAAVRSNKTSTSESNPAVLTTPDRLNGV